MASSSILSLRATASPFLVPSSPFSFSLSKPRSSSPSFSVSLNSIKVRMPKCPSCLLVESHAALTPLALSLCVINDAAGQRDNRGGGREGRGRGQCGPGKDSLRRRRDGGHRQENRRPAARQGFRRQGRGPRRRQGESGLPQEQPSSSDSDVTEGSEKLAEAIGSDSEAVICATGFRPGWDLFAPWKVDNFGTVNLVEACRKLGVNRFILISSILVNGAAMGQLLNPAYIFLNVFGLTLVAKLQAEQHIRRSGINYTIVRPGGLRNEPPKGNIVMEPEDTLYEGSISRDQVAEVAVEALNHPESSYKVVEIVAREDAPKRLFEELFGSIKQR